MLQSLFCWKTLCNFHVKGYMPDAKNVTVLVLLEDPLQQGIADTLAFHRFSYSPCFAGRPSATAENLLRLHKNLLFWPR